MSIDAGTLSTVSGLRVTKKMMDLVSQNITRAREPGFTKLDVDLGCSAYGNAEITRIKRIVDDWIIAEKQVRDAKTSYYESRSDFLKRIEILLGAPDTLENGIHGRNISSMIQKFFASFSKLASHPENNSQKSAVVVEGQALGSMFSTTVDRLYNLQLECDAKIEDSLNIINSNLEEINYINNYRMKVKDDQIRVNLDIKVDQYLQKITELCSMEVERDKNGRVFISINGNAVLNDSLYKFKYHPMVSLEEMLNGRKFNDIEIVKADETDVPQKLVYKEGDQWINHLGYGKIKGWLEVRDNEIPNVIAEIDNLAHTFTEEFNNVYSRGSNFPGKAIIESSQDVELNTQLKYTGHVRLAMLDNDGNPAEVESVGYMKPLQVNLEDIGDAVHPVTIQEFINEINQYYSIGNNTLHIDADDIDDIRLVTVLNSDNILKFRVEVDNNSQVEKKMNIKDVKLFYKDNHNNDVLVNNALRSDIKNYNHKVKSGETTRSSKNISIDMLDMPSEQGYVELTCDIGGGQEYKFRYQIKKGKGFAGERLGITEIAQGDSGARIVRPSNTSHYITACVEKNNGTLAKKGEYGKLVLKCHDSKYKIALDPIDSSERRQEVPDGILHNMFHSLGMNNFFVGSDTVEGSARKMAVVNNIIKDNNNVNTGLLRHASYLEDDKIGRFTYQIGAGNNLTAVDLANLSTKRNSFEAAGNISFVVNSFSGYATHIISDVVSRSDLTTGEYDREMLLKRGIDDKYDAVSGVNVDEELAKAMILENNFAAISKVLSIIDGLYKNVLDAL